MGRWRFCACLGQTSAAIYKTRLLQGDKLPSQILNHSHSLKKEKIKHRMEGRKSLQFKLAVCMRHIQIKHCAITIHIERRNKFIECHWHQTRDHWVWWKIENPKAHTHNPECHGHTFEFPIALNSTHFPFIKSKKSSSIRLSRRRTN